MEDENVPSNSDDSNHEPNRSSPRILVSLPLRPVLPVTPSLQQTMEMVSNLTRPRRPGLANRQSSSSSSSTDEEEDDYTGPDSFMEELLDLDREARGRFLSLLDRRMNEWRRDRASYLRTYTRRAPEVLNNRIALRDSSVLVQRGWTQHDVAIFQMAILMNGSDWKKISMKWEENSPEELEIFYLRHGDEHGLHIFMELYQQVVSKIIPDLFIAGSLHAGWTQRDITTFQMAILCEGPHWSKISQTWLKKTPHELKTFYLRQRKTAKFRVFMEHYKRMNSRPSRRRPRTGVQESASTSSSRNEVFAGGSDAINAPGPVPQTQGNSDNSSVVLLKDAGPNMPAVAIVQPMDSRPRDLNMNILASANPDNRSNEQSLVSTTQTTAGLVEPPQQHGEMSHSRPANKLRAIRPRSHGNRTPYEGPTSSVSSVSSQQPRADTNCSLPRGRIVARRPEVDGRPGRLDYLNGRRVTERFPTQMLQRQLPWYYEDLQWLIDHYRLDLPSLFGEYFQTGGNAELTDEDLQEEGND